MKTIMLASLAILAAACVVFFASGRLNQREEPTVRLDGADWVEVLHWDFAKGHHPDGWGWGDRRIADGTLEISDPGPARKASSGPRDQPGAATQAPASDAGGAVYFLPVAHGADFILETQVQRIQATHDGEARAHLGTRDGSHSFNVAGMAVFQDGRAYVRHTLNQSHVAVRLVEDLPELAPGTWHVLSLSVRKGRLSARVDGREIYGSQARRTGAIYAEPHLAVEEGTFRFRYLKVFASPEFRLPGVAATEAATPPGRESPDLPPASDWGLPDSHRPWWIRLMLYAFYAVILLVCIYMIRHYIFTLNRLFGTQRHPYLDVDVADWPKVTVLVPAHNEEHVIDAVLTALLEVDYPKDKIVIIPINDRSSDDTGEIIDRIAQRHPNAIKPFHRTEGQPGKAAALQDAMERVEDDIILVFDADYIPGHGLIKQLVAPFFDPEVGATMGRVVPHNVAQNLLTRALDLERAAGYQVDQQARMNLHLLPQYGGTVGGIRKTALQSVGGWNTYCLTEDTDATLRLILAGWKIVYQNRSECYEQVPETWPMRTRQLQRWARGHNQAMMQYSHRLTIDRRISWREKIDGLLLLHVYLLSTALLAGWGLGIVLWYLGVNHPGLIIILAVTSYSTLGNFAVFFEIAAAAYLDGSRERIRLLPFILLGFLVSLMGVTRVTLTQILYRRRNGEVLWHRTEHNHTRPSQWT